MARSPEKPPKPVRKPRAKPAAPSRAAPARTAKVATGAAPDSGPGRAGRTKRNGSHLRVRMYRQGLGDCFLISLLRPSAPHFHLMIDCGVILGTPDARDRLAAVVEDIIATTGGYVDVLAVTHEHYDHVAGFTLVKDLFVTPDKNDDEDGRKRKTPGKLSVGEVWFAWTEEPGDDLADGLRAERHRKLQALAGMAQGLQLGGDAVPSGVTGALDFFGIDLGAAGVAKVGDTAQAMMNAASFAPKSTRYHEPGDILRLPLAPEFRIYVLGPPRDRAKLMKLDASAGLYHLDGLGLDEAELTAGPRDDASSFDATWCFPIAPPDPKATGPQPLAEFLGARYFGPANPTPEADQSWRRIDGAWSGSAAEFALALDSATNNTSLAMAIELVGSGDVLLFPADAQLGNWMSWHDLFWKEPGCAATATALLARTVFYKVGHHGSHNATLKEKGLELMPAEGLTAFVPVDQAMAGKKRWHRMPLDALIAALTKRCGGDPVRIDKEPAASATISAGGNWDGFKGETKPSYGSLYIDWTIPIAPASKGTTART